MKLERILDALEDAVQQLGITLRRETGNFRGGRCTVGEEKVVLLNKRHPPEVHLAVLAESLRGLPVDTIYLKPSVRAALEEEWERMSTLDDTEDTHAAE